MNVNIKLLSKDDTDLFISLINLFEEVFEMKDFRMPERGHLDKVLRSNGFQAWVALNESSEVVGGLTAYELRQYYSTRPLVYIYDLAVKSDLQRKGIGNKLICSINEYCQKAGVEEVFVQADRVDQHAVDFYRKTGATEEDVLHFYYDLEKWKATGNEQFHP